MKILVIGSEGFIGKHLMEQGRAIGYEMFGMDICGNPQFRKNVADVTSRDVSGLDRVIDSAGVLGTAETFAAPEHAVHVNVLGAITVLNACRREGVPMTYITLGNDWLNPYSITKNCAADFVRMFHTAYGLPTQVAVAYNLFGPYQKWTPVRKIVPDFMVKMLRDEPVDLFFGGLKMVDLVYAPDVAKALLMNMDTGMAHYGTGASMSVQNVLAACALALDLNPKINSLGPRPGETGEAAIAPYPIANITPIDEAMRVTADWYRKAVHG